jgi:RNA polymerase sigma factor (sigma-70 family)
LLGRESEREIEFRLRELSRRQLISPEELDDIRQELVGALMKNSARFDPKRSSKRTFLCAVIQKQLRHILSQRKNDVEKCGQPVKSLETMLESEQPVYNDARQGELSETDRIDLQLDVQSVVELFTSRQRKICRLLMENQTPQRIAANLGLEEKILKRDLDQIREAFIDAGYGPN